MNCPNCQTAVQPGTRFCIACGAKLEAVQQPTMNQAAAPAAVQPAMDQTPAPAAPTPAYQVPAPVEPVAAPNTTIMVVPAAQSRGTALALEAVAAIFGIFGVGWLYSGNTSIGIVLLIAGFGWDIFAFFIAFVTLGFAGFCLVPIHMVLVLGSVLLLTTATPKTV